MPLKLKDVEKGLTLFHIECQKFSVRYDLGLSKKDGSKRNPVNWAFLKSKTLNANQARKNRTEPKIFAK